MLLNVRIGLHLNVLRQFLDIHTFKRYNPSNGTLNSKQPQPLISTQCRQVSFISPLSYKVTSQLWDLSQQHPHIHPVIIPVFIKHSGLTVQSGHSGHSLGTGTGTEIYTFSASGHTGHVGHIGHG